MFRASRFRLLTDSYLAEGALYMLVHLSSKWTGCRGATAQTHISTEMRVILRLFNK